MIEILNGIRETVSYSGNLGARLFLNQEAEDYPIHWHTAVELIMPLVNYYTVVVNEVPYVLQPGDIIIIPSGELHQLFAPEEGKRIIFQFDYSLLSRLHGFDSTFHMYHPCHVVTADKYEDIHSILYQFLLDMKKEFESNAVLKEASIYSMIIQFFVALGRVFVNGDTRFPNIKRSKHHEYIEKFLTVCNYIHENCTENLSVEDLAELAGFSKFHFTRLFKQFTGMTFYNYLNQQRIMYAEKLLGDPNLSITEVAMSAGFASISTFNRLFKDYKKYTPSEYRNLHGPHCLSL